VAQALVAARASAAALALVTALYALGCRNGAAPSALPSASVSEVSSAASAAPVAPAARRIPAGTNAPPRVALGTHGAVSSAELHASRVGRDVLARGGNAVDAAIAVAFALAVTQPSAGNLGGGGFMVVRMADGRAVAFDYREKAPAAAHRDMYLDENGEATEQSLVGPKAAGIPGTVAGMALAHRRFGSLPWRELVTPAVALARDGHTLDSFHAADLASGVRKMRAAGFAASAAHYRHREDRPYREAEVWKQPQLAGTLESIAARGEAAFYQGVIAEQLVTAVRDGGGVWSLADLAAYRAVEREPIRFRYRDHEILSMPPPSAGGVVLRQILGASELLALERHPWRTPEAMHLYLEATRRAYADRNMLLADPDFVKLPLERLLAVSYLRERIQDIDPAKATASSAIRAGLEQPSGSEETTHFSVVDRWGNAVANTYTLNTGFGCKFVAQGTGVLLNNEMDDFSVKPGSANVYGLVQSEPNRVEPGKRMLSSMTPTIVVKDGEVRAVLGSPGGPTITTTVAQLIIGIVNHGDTIDVAVARPRLHHQWLPDRVFVEETVEPSIVRGLERLGHRVNRRGPIGHANCIEIDLATRGFRAVADVGRDGGAALALAD